MEIQDKNQDQLKTGCWKKSKDYKTKVLDGELAILNEATGAIHILNQVGADIYNFLNSGRSSAEIVDHVLERYEADKKTVTSDVLSLLKDMRELGIIFDVKK